jgi:adenylate kinase family enzyme
VRIAIIGSPRAGKTTLAEQLGRTLGCAILHTDDLAPLGWSAASAEVARVLHSAGDIIIEGVAAVRGLRKALAACSCRPCERCIILEQPRLPLSSHQLAMARGCITILREIEPELRQRNVLLERLRPEPRA